jgi:hypothetical protein
MAMMTVLETLGATERAILVLGESSRCPTTIAEAPLDGPMETRR